MSASCHLQAKSSMVSSSKRTSPVFGGENKPWALPPNECVSYEHPSVLGTKVRIVLILVQVVPAWCDGLGVKHRADQPLYTSIVYRMQVIRVQPVFLSQQEKGVATPHESTVGGW